ncbi:hypothetical protein ACH50O_11625 [Methylomonas sp. 2BW1-5-20]|uniref:hypothetical protein n=1 Tax=Methylomonas sp. 2BW1-5-20 TaxID=3376686 RepID=UPI0040502A67
MSIKALQAARSKLMNDAPLNAFWQTRYGRAARHLIGYRRPVSANDYPSICYVPANGTRASTVGGRHQERVSLVVGIHEPDITDDVFDGVTQLDLVEQLIFDCLEAGELGPGAVYLGEAKTIHDLSVRHPFHEMEISMLLAAR